LTQFPIHRLLEFIDLTDAERQIMDDLYGAPFELERGRVLRRVGDEVQEVYLLLDGWVISAVGTSAGGRQIVKVHLPGDMLGSPSMVLKKAAETLTAITTATVARVSLKKFGDLFVEAPRLAAAMFMSVQQERVLLMDRITSVGRTRAAQRVSALLIHIYDRLRVLQPDQASRFLLPLTQEQMGDALGLTTVHINRTFRELIAGGLVQRYGQDIELFDVPRLRRMASLPEREWQRYPEWLPKRA
jgi:CRP/FNR family transcriptional regulator, anaerobic regulatory protein